MQPRQWFATLIVHAIRYSEGRANGSRTEATVTRPEWNCIKTSIRPLNNLWSHAANLVRMAALSLVDPAEAVEPCDTQSLALKRERWLQVEETVSLD